MLSIILYKAAPPEKKGVLSTLALFGVNYLTSYYYAGGLSLY